MKITTATKLDQQQQQLVAELTARCCAHDGITLSYPTAESNLHLLLFNEDKLLVSVLGMVELEDSLMECSAFTLPAFRRQGYFSHLLSTALELSQECDIIFAVDESGIDTMAVLQALEAQLEAREFLMEYSFDKPKTMPALFHDHDLTLHETAGQWVLLYQDIQVGQCETTPVSPTSICLHHVTIEESYRRQGFGHDLISLLLHHLSQQEIKHVILQVSGDNHAAIQLYQKTGFRITRTLSYYYY